MLAREARDDALVRPNLLLEPAELEQQLRAVRRARPGLGRRAGSVDRRLEKADRAVVGREVEVELAEVHAGLAVERGRVRRLRQHVADRLELKVVLLVAVRREGEHERMREEAGAAGRQAGRRRADGGRELVGLALVVVVRDDAPRDRRLARDLPGDRPGLRTGGAGGGGGRRLARRRRGQVRVDEGVRQELGEPVDDDGRLRDRLESVRRGDEPGIVGRRRARSRHRRGKGSCERGRRGAGDGVEGKVEDEARALGRWLELAEAGVNSRDAPGRRGERLPSLIDPVSCWAQGCRLSRPSRAVSTCRAETGPVSGWPGRSKRCCCCCGLRRTQGEPARQARARAAAGPERARRPSSSGTHVRRPTDARPPPFPQRPSPSPHPARIAPPLQMSLPSSRPGQLQVRAGGCSEQPDRPSELRRRRAD